MSKQVEIIKLSYDKGYRVTKDGKLLNPNGVEISLGKSNKGYLSFNIRINGSGPTRSFVHRLQAYQKFGDKMFNDGIVVRHKNGDSTDNSYNNILIGTQLDNMSDIPKIKRINNASNPIYDHESIIKDRKIGLTYKDIMGKYGIPSKGTVSFIINKSLKNIAG